MQDKGALLPDWLSLREILAILNIRVDLRKVSNKNGEEADFHLDWSGSNHLRYSPLTSFLSLVHSKAGSKKPWMPKRSVRFNWCGTPWKTRWKFKMFKISRGGKKFAVNLPKLLLAWFPTPRHLPSGRPHISWSASILRISYYIINICKLYKYKQFFIISWSPSDNNITIFISWIWCF